MAKTPKNIGISERLLTVDLVAQRLGVVPTTVRRHLTELELSGLKRIEVGGGTRLVRFTEESLNRMINRAAERDEPLIKEKFRVSKVEDSQMQTAV